VHLDLIVPRVGVYEAEFLARHCFYPLIDPREEEAILWADFIEVSEVDTHPLFAILLLHDDLIREPVRVVGLSDETNMQ